MASPLLFADLETPGISRRLLRKKWAYFDPGGQRITDPDTIDRLQKIGLPPAYRDAWYSPNPDAHILAMGLDEKGRRQYRYHPDFIAARDSLKFERCAAFGAALPLIRKQVAQDLAKRSLTKERALACVVRLLDSGRIRIGNQSYARANKSFGATTLLQRHARLRGDRLTLRFRAKSGKLCTFSVTDRGLIRFVKTMQDLPGQHLFQYLGDGGAIWPINSSDVNLYIKDAMKAEFSAKDFRTWRASVLAYEWLRQRREGMTLKQMLAFVAEHLGNTPAIARKSYIHPLLIDMAQTSSSRASEAPLPRSTRWLSREERGLIALMDDPV